MTDNNKTAKTAGAGNAGDERVAALAQLQILDSLQETAYDDITRMAADVCEVPIALITLVDGHRQWFKSRVGLQLTETPLEHSFCAHAIESPLNTMVVPDTLSDDRFADNPLVKGEPNIRFYAGAPLVLDNGIAVGTLCVIDQVSRELSDDQLQTLQFMAQQVVSMLASRREAATVVLPPSLTPPTSPEDSVA